MYIDRCEGRLNRYRIDQVLSRASLCYYTYGIRNTIYGISRHQNHRNNVKFSCKIMQFKRACHKTHVLAISFVHHLPSYDYYALYDLNEYTTAEDASRCKYKKKVYHAKQRL